MFTLITDTNDPVETSHLKLANQTDDEPSSLPFSMVAAPAAAGESLVCGWFANEQMMCLKSNQNALHYVCARLLLLSMCCFCTIDGQCPSTSTGPVKTAATAAALVFFKSLVEQKFCCTINSTKADNSSGGGNKHWTTRQLVLQFIHQSLDKLINKQLQIWWKKDPDSPLWTRLMDFPDPEPLIDLLACLDQFASDAQPPVCNHLVSLDKLYTATIGDEQAISR